MGGSILIVEDELVTQRLPPPASSNG